MKKLALLLLFVSIGAVSMAQNFQIRNPGPGGTPTQGVNYPVDFFSAKDGIVYPSFQAAFITNSDTDSTCVVTVTTTNVNYTISIPPGSSYRWPNVNSRPYSITLTVKSHTAPMYIQVIY